MTILRPQLYRTRAKPYLRLPISRPCQILSTQSPHQQRHYASATSTPFKVTRMSGALGAAITDLDLTSLTPDTIKAIRQTFLDHSVLFFRPRISEPLTPSDFLQFSSHFGKPIQYPFVSGISPDHPQIIRVLKKEHEKTNFGGIWHSDTSYLEVPPMATMLMAETIPAFGGDTIFANQYLAYETLSAGLKQILEGLNAVNTSAKADTSKTREDRIKDSSPGGAQSQPENYAATHPVVRTHPETGRKSLYVNTAHTSHFENWTEKESEGLLGFLHEHQVKVELTGRWKWQRGDIAWWDNRCVLHNPVNDYQGMRRSMLRITMEGDRPV